MLNKVQSLLFFLSGTVMNLLSLLPSCLVVLGKPKKAIHLPKLLKPEFFPDWERPSRTNWMVETDYTLEFDIKIISLPLTKHDSVWKQYVGLFETGLSNDLYLDCYGTMSFPKIHNPTSFFFFFFF